MSDEERKLKTLVFERLDRNNKKGCPQKESWSAVEEVCKKRATQLQSKATN